MKDYFFLKSAKVLFKVLALAALALGILAGVIVFIRGTGAVAQVGVPQAPNVTGAIFIIMGFIYSVILYTISEVIGILLDIQACCSKPKI